jgi:hypothetical protein
VGRTQEFLFFSHQSFQEFLAANYVSTRPELIEHVLNDMWHPKWREVIKFLAGFNGVPIIQAITQHDNVIHAPLFLAAECWAETASKKLDIGENHLRKYP